MPLVSVTRLRVRSYLYLLPFAVWALRSWRQAQRSEGFLGSELMGEAGNIFWTLTVWRDDAAMSAYRIAGAHRGAMPKLLGWCDEASVTHWTQETPELPTWDEAYQRLLKQGRPSKVNNPSARHLAHQIPAPHPGRVKAQLPASRSS